ncbi:MAG: hypothetical protein MZW92_01005 [Comamonadaceae bacterium]|nr:hypothetical protein [Comamonadaceae bacterium]
MGQIDRYAVNLLRLPSDGRAALSCRTGPWRVALVDSAGDALLARSLEPATLRRPAASADTPEGTHPAAKGARATARAVRTSTGTERLFGFVPVPRTDLGGLCRRPVRRLVADAYAGPMSVTHVDHRRLRPSA